MKRYLAFHGAIYYPSQGMGDFVGDFDTLEEAIEQVEAGQPIYDYRSIWDSEKKEEVYSSID